MKVIPKSRAEWRLWLKTNYNKKTEVWLVFYKRGTEKPTLTYDDAVEEALCFGWIDGVKRKLDEQRYMHRFTPRQASSRWSSTNRARVKRLIAAGSMTAAGLAAIDAAKARDTWKPKLRPVDLSVPPEFTQAFVRNKKAANFFNALAPSYQQQFTGWINSAKRADTRARRVDESIELLERGEKLGMG